MNYTFSDSEAFTLMELMAVLVIVAVLAALTFPQYKKVVEKSRAATVLPVMNVLRRSLDEEILSGRQTPIDFVGSNGGGGEMLSVRLNCAVAREDGRCYVKNFGYRVWCTEVGCFAGVLRQDGPNRQDHYALLSRKLVKDWNDYPVGVWENMCMAHTELGFYVCTFLAQTGWQMSDERKPY